MTLATIIAIMLSIWDARNKEMMIKIVKFVIMPASEAPEHSHPTEYHPHSKQKKISLSLFESKKSLYLCLKQF